MPLCPNCNSQQPDGAVFCDECGATLGALAPTPAPPGQSPTQPSPAMGSGAVCSVCGAPTVPGEAFCDNCGAALGAGLPAAAPPAPAPTPPPAAPAPSSGLTCQNCGASLEPGSNFCDMCGAAVSAPAPSAPPQPPQPEPAPPAHTPPPAPAPQPPQPEPAPPAHTPPPAPAPQPPQPEPAPPAYTPPPAPAPQPPQPEPAPPAPFAAAGIIGRLVVQGTNAALSFPPHKTELIVGREDPVSGVFPEVDLTDHGGDEGGVSRRHARIFVQGNQLMVEDLNSTNYTYVNQNRLSPGQPHPLNDGDELRMGRVKMNYFAS